MKLAALSLTFASLTTGVHALEFNGAIIGSDYFIYDERPAPEGQSFEGSVELGFGAFAMQVDAAIFNIYDPNDPIPTGTIHGIYNVSDALALGAFYGVEDWSEPEGIAYDNYGVEAIFRFAGAPVEIEAYWYETVGRETGPYIADVFSVKATYGLSENASLHAAYVHSTDNDGRDVDIYVVGGDYRFNNGISVGAEYVMVEDFDSLTAFGLHISKSFGGGVTFGQRDWHNVHYGY